MSVFDDYSKDSLEEEIRYFLESRTIVELLEVVKWCVENKENDYISGKDSEQT